MQLPVLCLTVSTSSYQNLNVATGECHFLQDSSVGIATGYGLDGPGIDSLGGEGRDFPYLSRPTLGPTHHPVQWVPGLSPGVKQPGRGVDHTHPHLAPRLKKE